MKSVLATPSPRPLGRCARRDRRAQLWRRRGGVAEASCPSSRTWFRRRRVSLNSSVFVEAVNAADLSTTLRGLGPTRYLLRPTMRSRRCLGELGVTKDALLANKPLLTTVLKYHVLSGAVRKADIPLGKAIVPLSGGFFKIEAEGSALKLTDGRNRVTNVISTDGAALNGVIHTVHRVLLPANQDIVQTAQSTPSLSILVEAVVAAGLVGTLKGPRPLHSLCADQQRVRGAAGRARRDQGRAACRYRTADQGAHLPRATGTRPEGRDSAQHAYPHRARVRRSSSIATSRSSISGVAAAASRLPTSSIPMALCTSSIRCCCRASRRLPLGAWRRCRAARVFRPAYLFRGLLTFCDTYSALHVVRT